MDEPNNGTSISEEEVQMKHARNPYNPHVHRQDYLYRLEQAYLQLVETMGASHD